MENIGHFIKAETRLVVHTFISTTSSTKHGVQKRTYLSIIGQSLMISGRSWKKKRGKTERPTYEEAGATAVDLSNHYGDETLGYLTM
jgi:hypothetical protein